MLFANKMSVDSPTLNKLRKQISAEFTDIFRDNLENELKKQSIEGVYWMAALHRELIIRLCMFIPNRHDIQDQIADACDPVIFKQLLETGNFKVVDLSILVEYVYMWMKKFCAPVRDSQLNDSLTKLRGMLHNSDLKLFRVVSEFVVTVHADMDAMDGDMESKMVQDFQSKVKEILKKK